MHSWTKKKPSQRKKTIKGVIMAEVTNQTEQYRSQLENYLTSDGIQEPGWLSEIRRQAMNHFDELGFPTPKHEDWRETNIRPIIGSEFVEAVFSSIQQSDIDPAIINRLKSTQLVFANGKFSNELSTTTTLPDGVNVGSLAEAWTKQPDAIEPYFARLGSFEQQPFAALNTALMQDGVFIYVPQNTVVEEPIHVVFASKSNGSPTVSFPRVLVVTGKNSQVKIVETYIGSEGDVYFTNAVSEFVCGENAHIEHVKFQRESESAFHIANTKVIAEANANFKTHSLAFGGSVARCDYLTTLNGEGITCTLNGLYMPHGKQHVDHRLTVEHTKPNCNSHQLYKGILNDTARAIFRGKFHVFQDAQKTDAYQSNNNILLSSDAEVNTRPQLEIYADDVKCSHGATIGRLDQDQIFYLQSRCVNAESARSLLVYAFAYEIIDQIGIEAIHPDITKLIVSRLPNKEIFEGM
jgi:Fe-S cluster assembly protein SufD